MARKLARTIAKEGYLIVFNNQHSFLTGLPKNALSIFQR